MRVVCWYSCGAASAVAAKLTLSAVPDAVVAYCETNAEHPDNARFMADCESWFDAPIKRLSSTEYFDTWDVWEQRRYIAGHHGAPCTGALKKAPRIAFQKCGDLHVFGYTSEERDRAVRFRANHPELKMSFPLIDRGIDKSGALALVEAAGIALPELYALGFDHNNCIPCPKSQSPNYWAAIRKHFPEQFERMNKLSRELGARLTKLNGHGDERFFLDEIPADQPTNNPTVPACDFMCHLAEQDMKGAA